MVNPRALAVVSYPPYRIEIEDNEHDTKFPGWQNDVGYTQHCLCAMINAPSERWTGQQQNLQQNSIEGRSR